MATEVEVDVVALVWAGLAEVRQSKMGTRRIGICILRTEKNESDWSGTGTRSRNSSMSLLYVFSSLPQILLDVRPSGTKCDVSKS